MVNVLPHGFKVVPATKPGGTTLNDNFTLADALKGNHEALVGVVATKASTAALATKADKADVDAAVSNLQAEINGIETNEGFIWDQGIPSSVWTIYHPLNRYPAVAVVDSAGTEVNGEKTYLGPSSIRISFNGSFSGKAYLS